MSLPYGIDIRIFYSNKNYRVWKKKHCVLS